MSRDVTMTGSNDHMTEMTDKPRKRGRRHPLATLALIGAALLGTGGAYALATIPAGADDATDTAALVAQGEKLFDANCASCHGLDLAGTADAPSLIGVGAASVDFQVGTGRMPMAMTGPQAMVKPVQFTKTQIAALAAYVADVSPGPGIPSDELLASGTNLSLGGELFRINCAMCHNVAAAGGALTEGKFAPELQTVDPVHIYEAMQTGPQNMPVFSDTNLTAQDKADIITAIVWMTDNTNMIGGYNLGGVGPVAEGLFIWVFGIGGAVAFAIWLTSRPN